MLKVENIEVTGWEAAIRGMRNPMNSWVKSDSGVCGCCGDCDIFTDFNKCPHDHDWRKFVIGPNDLKLMRQLAKAGPVHAKYRRMINVTMDITAPLYYFKELDTYKVGTVCNSCSTMHKIQAKEFTLEDFSYEHLEDNEYCAYCEDPDSYERRYIPLNSFKILDLTIDALNYWRDKYNDATEKLKQDIWTQEKKKYLKGRQKDFWWQMIQLLPSSYNQRRTYQFNYEVLSHIYFDRKDHKLDCWHQFCDVIKSLPYADDIIIGEEDSDKESE